MSDLILQTLIVTCGVIITPSLLALVIAFFGGGGSGVSNFEKWLSYRQAERLAKLKIEEAKQLHERHCPRLTDTPRKP